MRQLVLLPVQLLLLACVLPRATASLIDKFDTIMNGRYYIFPASKLSSSSVETGRTRVKPLSSVGRQFLIALDEDACSSNPPSPSSSTSDTSSTDRDREKNLLLRKRANRSTTSISSSSRSSSIDEGDCHAMATASLTQAGCSDYISYPSLQIISAVCFGSMEGAETTPDKVENSLLQKIEALPFVKGATADLRIRGLFQERAITEEEIEAAAAEEGGGEAGEEEEVEAAGIQGALRGPMGRKVIKAISTGAAKSLYKGMGKWGEAAGEGGEGGEGSVSSGPTSTPAPTRAPTTIPTSAPPIASNSSSSSSSNTSSGGNSSNSTTTPTTNNSTGASKPSLSPTLSPSTYSGPPPPQGGGSPWVLPDDINWGLDRINQLDLKLDRNTNTCQTIAGGASVGVAPLAEIRCIKALDEKGVGNLAHAIAALEMIATARLADPHTPMVASLSISTPANAAINAAVARLQALGVVVVSAAGNDGKPVQYYSPASEDSAITVGAIQPPLPPGTSIFIPEKGDKREAYSNQGALVDIYAPGTNIYSADIKHDQAYSYRTGTSQAAPFVAGAVACVLGDALAAGGPVACRSSSTLLQSLLNPDVEVKQRAKGSRSFSDTRRPMLYVPPGAEYNLDCPLPAGLVAAMAATVGKGA
ncbi:proprotein convertase subtilisin kexin type 9 preproprotein [Nannochloropsis oceanica]